MTDCRHCEHYDKLRRYSFAQGRLIDRLHRRAQVAEGALLKYVKAMQRTEGIHGSLYQPKTPLDGETDDV